VSTTPETGCCGLNLRHAEHRVVISRLVIVSLRCDSADAAAVLQQLGSTLSVVSVQGSLVGSGLRFCTGL
jgi:hypothetical protein